MADFPWNAIDIPQKMAPQTHTRDSEEYDKRGDIFSVEFIACAEVVFILTEATETVVSLETIEFARGGEFLGKKCSAHAKFF